MTLSAKVSKEFRQEAVAALQRTSAGTISRFIQGCFEDLIQKHRTGTRIVEPIELLTDSQRRRLERE